MKPGANNKKSLRTCENGHQYYKTSLCPVCPECEAARAPVQTFLKRLYAPARRALEKKGIISLELLSQYKEEDVLALHGVGKTTIPVLRKVLQEAGLRFRK